MMRNPGAHAVVLRRFDTNLRDSVYEQMLWAIHILGVSKYWKATTSPLRLIYKPTGQKIVFRGADDPLKIKSIKFHDGHCRYIWFEELAEFIDMESVRNVLQSLMRGGDKTDVFYSYNPPQSINSWVNQEALIPQADLLRHHSTYLDAPREWLGSEFLIMADHLMRTKPEKYRHEYLGEATGTGGEVFRNLTIREITAEERASFSNYRLGGDFGYSIDPLAWVHMEYDKTRRKLYMLDEVYGVGMKLRKAAEEITARGMARYLSTWDNSQRDIDELCDLGINAVPAIKGPNSRDSGYKWLVDLEEIIIDPVTCPNPAREFSGYEYEADRFGAFKHKYPDGNDHSMDAARYGLEDDMRGEMRLGPVKMKVRR